jgi:GTP diphosphokinase / guanosine-3',5'-bis(diphosphate) 3'-diphosphatase
LKKEILKRYRALLKASKSHLQKGDKEIIRRAFDLAVNSHKDMRRKSGEPYIYHPIAVAQICAEEIGLGTTSIVCALLHDVVEDTPITIDEIKAEFGPKVASIIDGLTKISGVFDHTTSSQAENFRKMLLTLADDVRVILIKLADRLHNMRTMNFMPRDKQIKLASETSYLYAPLAHRLGLYTLKSELEDLSLKYTDPVTYSYIAEKLNNTKSQRNLFIKDFIAPITERLDKNEIKYTITGRPKSIFSIWNKMKKKNVPFEEVYDLFAIRIVVNSTPENEKADCWKVYSIVTDYYRPNPDRLRDWVSTPKGNGYESLHTTVMSQKGAWVEVQIRTNRMNEIAEKGFAAHWKYKESSSDTGLDEWLRNVREILSNPENNTIDFLDDFQMNLFSDEIFVFTPKGDLRKLPTKSTVLDFAFDIHSDVGSKCIGGKIGHKLVPINHVLKNGDQVEIITSAKQKPSEDWLNIVITARAKSKIKSSLKEEIRSISEEGKEILHRKLRAAKIEYNQPNIHKLSTFYKFKSAQDFFVAIAQEKVDFRLLKDFLEIGIDGKNYQKADEIVLHPIDQLLKEVKSQATDSLLIGEDMQKIDYKLSPCCNPIPGDDVFGFITVSEGIKIHRVNCPNAARLLSNFSYRVVKAKWNKQKEISFLTGIKIKGTDEVGLVNNITAIISNDFKVNMRSITIDTNEGLFEGVIMVYVNDTEHLEDLIKKMYKVSGVQSISRFDVT